MKKIILGAFLVTCICAYQQKYNFNIVFDKIEYKNVPPYFKLDHSFQEKPSVNNFRQDMTVQSGVEATVNEFADTIFKNIRLLMIQADLDPFAMPDLHSGFNYTLIITYHGELDLTDGMIHNIVSIHRNGDVVVSYSTIDKYLEVTIPISFDELSFTYDYNAKIMGLGPVGGIEGKVNGITVEVKIGFDVNTLELTLDQFDVTDAGHISFHFTGNSLIDWLLNLLTEVITTLLKQVILSIIESVIRGGLDTIIDFVNGIVGGIINPTTLAPTTENVQFFNNILMDLRK